MTPEQQAADRIARGACVNTDWRLGMKDCDSQPCPGCIRDGRRAVEAIAAAGLLIVPAERMTALLDLARAATALAQSEESMKAALAGHPQPGLHDPWPEADALVAALQTLGDATVVAAPADHGASSKAGAGAKVGKVAKSIRDLRDPRDMERSNNLRSAPQARLPRKSPPERMSFTLTDAAVTSGLSVPTLRRHEKAGRLRFFKVGGRTLVDAASLRTLLTGESA